MGSGSWKETIGPNSSIWVSLTRPSPPLTAFGSRSALVLGGNTKPHELAASSNLLRGVLQFDFGSKTFLDPNAQNVTVNCCNATGGIGTESLHHVPSSGSEGIYIAMGGLDGWSNGAFAGLNDFGTVSDFDSANQNWLNQTTSGSKPAPG